MLNEQILTSLLSMPDTSLRPYQSDNKKGIYNLWLTKRSVMLQMPTGTGKTRLFSSLLNDLQTYASKERVPINCLVMVHRMELVEQIVKELQNTYGLSSGIIQAGYKQDPEKTIQVASVQTLSRRLNIWKEKDFDLVIVDEAHHVPAESYRTIIKSYPNAKILGVTATPYRLSGEGFTDIFEGLIISPTIKQFIEMGYLSSYDYYSVSANSEVPKELEKVHVLQGGDFTDADMSRICDNDHIRAQIIETYQKYASGKKGIVYTINKAHNLNLCNDFNSSGVRTVAIDSQTPSEVRSKYISDFRDGKIDVICNVNIFSEGFDCPDIEFVQLARPTQSLSMYLQQIGRGLRVVPGKEKCLFLDNVGLYNRFGLPSANRKWMYHFLGHDENIAPRRSNKKGLLPRKKKDLSEGDEQVFLIETTTGLRFEKKRAGEIFREMERVNDLLIARDDHALSILETEFSTDGKSALCFDGNKVTVWKDTNSDSQFWSEDFYLKNFMFRFEYEPESRYLSSVEELNKWLTFRFLQIRDSLESKEIYDIKRGLCNMTQDQDYIIEMYSRWLDNDSDKPAQRSLIIEQLISQTCDFIFEKDSGNRVFQMILQMPSDRRKISLGR